MRVRERALVPLIKKETFICYTINCEDLEVTLVF